MTTLEFLQQMAAEGVKHYVRSDGALRCRAIPEHYTAPMRMEVDVRRPMLISLLTASDEQIKAFEERAAIAQHDGGLSELAAEWLAHVEVFEPAPTRISKERP